MLNLTCLLRHATETQARAAIGIAPNIQLLLHDLCVKGAEKPNTSTTWTSSPVARTGLRGPVVCELDNKATLTP
jgi:hypothetical protein